MPHPLYLGLHSRLPKTAITSPHATKHVAKNESLRRMAKDATPRTWAIVQDVVGISCLRACFYYASIMFISYALA